MRLASSSRFCGVLLTFLVGGVAAAHAVPVENPYLSLTNRNAFGIKPPPPPAEPAPPPPPPPSPPPNVFLTGVSHSGGQKKAYFAINRPGGKQPEFETVREGEEFEDLKVLEIDAKGGKVRTVIAGKEVTLSFADNGLKSTGGGPVPGGLPGAVPGRPGSIPTPVAPVPTPAAAAAAGPVVIGRGGSTAGANVGAPGIAPPIAQPGFAPGNVVQDSPGAFTQPATGIRPSLPATPIQNVDAGVGVGSGVGSPPPLPPPTRFNP